MQQERREVRGILSLGTLLRVSAISGLAIGEIFGVFAAVVSFMARGDIVVSLLIVLLAPFATAVFLCMVTLIGHPLYVALNRVGVPGLSKIVFDEVVP